MKFIHGRGLHLWKNQMSPTQESMAGNGQMLPQGTRTVWLSRTLTRWSGFYLPEKSLWKTSSQKVSSHFSLPGWLKVAGLCRAMFSLAGLFSPHRYNTPWQKWGGLKTPLQVESLWASPHGFCLWALQVKLVLFTLQSVCCMTDCRELTCRDSKCRLPLPSLQVPSHWWLHKKFSTDHSVCQSIHPQTLPYC